MKFVK